MSLVAIIFNRKVIILSCTNVYQNSPWYFNISKSRNTKKKKCWTKLRLRKPSFQFTRLGKFQLDKAPWYKSYRRLDFEPRPNNIIRLILPCLIYLLLKSLYNNDPSRVNARYKFVSFTAVRWEETQVMDCISKKKKKKETRLFANLPLVGWKFS